MHHKDEICLHGIFRHECTFWQVPVSGEGDLLKTNGILRALVFVGSISLQKVAVWFAHGVQGRM